MMEALSYIIPAAISAVVAFVISYITIIKTISFKLGEISAKVDSSDKRMDKLEDRMDRLEDKLDKFILGTVSGGEGLFSELKTHIDKLDEDIRILESIRRRNPLSSSDLERMKTYRDKIAHGESLDIKEYRDFKSIAEKMREDLPAEKQDEFDDVMAGLSGFVGGMLVGDLISKRFEKKK